MNFLPRVKEYIKKQGIFRLPPQLEVFFSDSSVVSGVAGFGAYLEKYKGIRVNWFGHKKTAVLRFVKEVFPRPEQFQMEISECITVHYADDLGARNALGVLYSMLNQSENGDFVLPCCTITDWPQSSYRGLMIDPARGYIEPEIIRHRIFEMALCRYNKLHIHLLDGKGYVLKSDAVPQLSENFPSKMYDKQTLKELIAFAHSFSIDVIPELDLPGHSGFLLSVLPELKCQTGDKPSIWAVCVSNPNTYVLIEKLVDEICEVFDSQYIHMGGDELSFYDLEGTNFWHNWDECECCKALSKRNGYRTTAHLFYHFVRKVHEIVKRHNKKMIIWNDAIDISESPDIPRDIIIQFWRIAMEGRGPIEGCSFERFLEEGFTVINSHFSEVYACEYIKEDQMLTWSPFIRPDAPEKYKNQILGGELCAWDCHVHYAYSLSPLLRIFGDRLSTNRPLSLADINERTLFANVCGLTLFQTDIYSLLGGYVLSNYEIDKFFSDKNNCDAAKVTDLINELTAALTQANGYDFIIRGYLNCLEALLKAVNLKKGAA